jgi:uncharacterized protein (DUF433 family)
MNINHLICRDPEIFGGVPIFVGTRLPVAVLFENFAGGLSLDEILDSYPSLKREVAIAVLLMAWKCVEESALVCTF